MYHVFFGTKAQSIEPHVLHGQELTAHNGLWPITPLVFQHQVHGAHGLAITPETINQYKKILTHDSDYLVTNMCNVGIGVLTADCLSIALIDPINNALGVIHAGWRGSVQQIVRNAITHMTTLYKTDPQNLIVYCGSCAHACCYQVDEPFIKQLPEWAHAALITRDNHVFFDLLLCNKLVLLNSGVPADSIDHTMSQCTICNDQFCSYRKNPRITTRQMTIIWLD
jgi:YfiH family protein